MELLKALLLGFVQGTTEFLPVSSSGHLVLASHFLGFRDQGILFDVMVHVGTLFSVLAVFRREIVDLAAAPWRWLVGNRSDEVRHSLYQDCYIIIATIPAVVVGLAFKDSIEALFDSVLMVYVFLGVTGILMILSKRFADGAGGVSGVRAFLMGCGQACAVIPGLSRSGTTIFTGMLLGVDREAAARFSFIMSIPVIIGAAVLNIGEVAGTPQPPGMMLTLAAGTVMAAITGYLAIVLLLDVIRRNRLAWFGYYCLVVSGAGIVTNFFLH